MRRNVVYETGKYFLAGVLSLCSLETGLLDEAIRISKTTRLLGDWKKTKNGSFEVDPEGKEGFSAVAYLDTGIAIVENSRWLLWCNETSQSFMMPDGRLCGNLDEPGTYGMAYSLPPDLYKEAA